MRHTTLLAASVALSLAFTVAGPSIPSPSARADTLSADAKRKAYEEEMLAQARAEAEERRREMAKARAEEERIAAEELRREEEARRLSERLKTAAEARKAAEVARRKQDELAEAQRKAEEAARIAETKRRADEEAARVAEAQRRAEAERIAEAKRRTDEEAARIAEAQRRAEAERIAEAKRRTDEEAARIAEAQRRAETERMAEAKRRADEEATRIAEAQRQAEEARLAEAQRKAEAHAAAPAAPAGATDRQFTILIVMEPGHRGIRRHNPTADPILCANGGCFVSAGSDSAAEFLPGRKAMGLGATFGRRAGACREQLGCVFRSLELGTVPFQVQPVDMRLVQHDRRAPQEIVRDSQCRLDHGTIDCARPYVGPDYIMWVVPEWMAEHVGSAGLEAAVSRGLITRAGAAVAVRPGTWN